MSGIGSLYDTSKVVIGQAAGFVALPNTPLPADSITVFDETVWLNTIVGLGGATGGTWTLTLSSGPLAAPVTISAIPFGVTNTTLAASIQAVLPAGYTAIVTGTGAIATPFNIAITGPGSAQIIVTGSGSSLTGLAGSFLLTPSPWTAAGATEQGWQTQYNPSVQDTYIEEQQTQVAQQINTATWQFIANLAQDTVQSLQWALSATKTVQAPDSTHFGKTKLNLSGAALPTYAVALETKTYAGMPRRFYVPVATCAVQVSQSYRRANGMRMVPVTFTSICPIEQIEIDDITANHS